MLKQPTMCSKTYCKGIPSEGMKYCGSCLSKRRVSAAKRKTTSDLSHDLIQSKKQTISSEVTNINRLVATDSKREIETKTEDLGDGHKLEIIHEKRVDLTQEQSTKNSVKSEAEHITSLIKNGTLDDLASKGVVQKITSEVKVILRKQVKLLEAGGYNMKVATSLLKDYNNVILMIKSDSSTEGSYPIQDVVMKKQVCYNEDDVPQYTIEAFTPSNHVYTSNLLRFYEHCCCYRAVASVHTSAHVILPMLSSLPWSVYFDMIMQIQTKHRTKFMMEETEVLCQDDVVQTELEFNLEIWNIAVSKAVFGRNGDVDQRYYVREAITRDAEQGSYLDIDIDEFEMDDDRRTTATLFVRGKQVHSFKTRLGWDDLFLYSLMFPKYRSRFSEELELDAKDHLTAVDVFLSQKITQVQQTRNDLLEYCV